jgi:cell division protein FtsQ
VPANGLPARLGTTTIRVLGVLVLAASALVLLYAAARYSSLFALEEVDVAGGGPDVRQEVRAAVASLRGESLIALDQDELRQRLEALPRVRSARIDRAFPHTLRIAIVQERPLAVVESGEDAWLVSAEGRVIRTVDRGSTDRPVVHTPPGLSLEPGTTVQADEIHASLAALRHVPASFPERVELARTADGVVTLALADGLELRLGQARSLALKLAVAARVLRGMSAEDAAGIDYLDVSVPERAVGGSTLNSQVEG